MGMTGNTYEVDGEPGVPASEGESFEQAAARLRGCTVENRERVRRAAAVIRSHPKCAGADVLAPNRGPRDAWTCEITLDAGECPPAVLRTLADQRLGVLEARPRGAGYHVIARA